MSTSSAISSFLTVPSSSRSLDSSARPCDSDTAEMSTSTCRALRMSVPPAPNLLLEGHVLIDEPRPVLPVLLLALRT